MLKINTNMLSKKLNVKKKDKWPFDYLLWKRWAHSLMKQSISCWSVSCTFIAIGIKWCLSWNFLYLWILIMALSSTAALVGQLMTLTAIFFHVELITIPSTTKTWPSWVMWRSIHNETPNIRTYHYLLHIACPFF